MNIIFVLAALFVGALCDSSPTFNADISISNEPSVNGILTGTMSWEYYPTAGPPVIQMRTDYTVGPIEYIDFNRRLRYLYCQSSCDSETWNSPQPLYIYQSATDTATPADNYNQGTRACTAYTKASPPNVGVAEIWVDASGLPCRAKYVDGELIEFTSVTSVIPATAFTDPANWGCPAQVCNREIDFMLVFDESGSIDDTSFSQMIGFGVGIGQAYVFGPQQTAMGCVLFSTTARLVSQLTIVQSNFINAMNSVSQLGGYTCITCGIQTAVNEWTADNRGVQSNIFVVLTDGRGNRQTSTFNSVMASAKALGILFFCVGVADSIPSEINFISSSIVGVQTAFFVVDYSQLSGILNSFVIATCIDIPGNPCGSGCLGFCSCGATCICPDSCNDNDPCTNDQCIAGQNGNGCQHTPASCNDNNQCTTDSCIPFVGCQHVNVSCDDSNPCTLDLCNANVGCQHPPNPCDDNDACTTDACTSSTGCTHTPITGCQCQTTVCPQTPCVTTQCDNANGKCDIFVPLNCNDNNLCSTKFCDNSTGQCTYILVNCSDGDGCTHDFCDPTTGCGHSPYNATIDCNDFNVCTDDTCVSSLGGCQHNNISCDDHNPCTTKSCNSILGCQYEQKDCSKDPTLANLIGDCYIALCSNTTGCYLEQIPGTTVDSCGVCNGDGKTCLHISTAAAIGISAGVLAAIIIAAVIVCAALGIFGGKKGYDIWLEHKNNMAGANTNPLYKDDGLSGNNPLYKNH